MTSPCGILFLKQSLQHSDTWSILSSGYLLCVYAEARLPSYMSTTWERTTSGNLPELLRLKLKRIS